MRRGLLVAALAAVVLAVGFVAARRLLFRDTAEPVSVQEAVGRLEAGEPAPKVRGARVPAAGVYEYETSGEERFEAFISATHPYPERTTITVTRGGCGVLMAWIPLEGRETEWDMCPGARGWGLAGIREAHEFFGQGDERRYSCADGVAFRPAGRWRFTCRFEDRADVYEGRAVGVETLRVGGSPVETIHVRQTDALSGEEEGSGSEESWYRRSDGLIVRRVAETSDRSPVPGGGTGTYTERYELRLLSLAPKS